ncbi:aminodeoxychorismate synthase component I [Endozoicomonas arenosclerae]|uniref:aminodeoxychorismate synthase component I n=1 Tax=Endozoicomonas arenosclerae TaxID=1633495 RepID=UPI000AF598FA|nr:aminodeoxychorismate synthase component I [Endozoicomonas arenosclerae]
MPFMNELFIVELDYLADSSPYFEPFSEQPWACYLDSCSSSLKKEQHSRFDIITAIPWAVVTVDDQSVIKVTNQVTGETQVISEQSPFNVLDELLSTMTPVDEPDLPFTGGALGFWGYELCSLIEPERIQPRSLETPLMSVGLYHWAIISDHHLNKTLFVSHPDMPAENREQVLDQIRSKTDSLGARFQLQEKFSATISEDEYKSAFDKVQQYILAGDTYEVNLTQEFTSRYNGDCWQAYKHLRTVSPAPYSAYLSHPDVKILSHSPERFIKVTERKVETHPIKGTRPRGKTPAEDLAQAEELLSSEKDRSENLMIVDLLRNDLGKVCKAGSISVPRLFELESYANVHHLVSTVTGELSPEHSVLELMEGAFPGGSITGAPKIRSMEIIRELEASARNVYCGAIGYISCNDKMDSSITIRTLIAQNHKLHCWGGGAIVADSDCHQEYQESITKVKNLMTALETFCE